MNQKRGKLGSCPGQRAGRPPHNGNGHPWDHDMDQEQNKHGSRTGQSAWKPRSCKSPVTSIYDREEGSGLGIPICLHVLANLTPRNPRPRELRLRPCELPFCTANVATRRTPPCNPVFSRVTQRSTPPPPGLRQDTCETPLRCHESTARRHERLGVRERIVPTPQRGFRALTPKVMDHSG